MLVDAFGREVTDIRISVTKRCNFGCIYCHDEGLGPILAPRMPHDDEMSIAEFERPVRAARHARSESRAYALLVAIDASEAAAPRHAESDVRHLSPEPDHSHPSPLSPT